MEVVNHCQQGDHNDLNELKRNSPLYKEQLTAKLRKDNYD